MSSVSANQDMWDRFEDALSDGATASEYWSRLDRSTRTLDALVNFLLIQFEWQGADMSRMGELVEQLECSSDSAATVSTLIAGAYELVVGRGCRPHVDMFDGLSPQHQRYLSLPTDPFHLGQLIGGRYHVEQRIGHGTFGVVYKLHDRLTGEEVACKAAHITNDELKCRFRTRQLRKERIAMHKLLGRGCPKCFKLRDHDEVPFLTMEFVDGLSLRDILTESCLEPRRAARYLAAVSRTVAYAHELGIVHRDLKPGNIIIDVDDKVFVVDFGLVGCMQLSKKNMLDPIIAGTRGYMAPEALSLESQSRIDGRTDIYSIGAMLHEMLTGERPPRVNQQGSGTKTVWPDSIPRQLARIGTRCLNQDPSDRYDDAYELATVLEAFASGV